LALTVCADDDANAVRLALAKSVDAIEAARPDRDDPARRHPAAARAGLMGDACAGGGARGTEAGEPAQSTAATALADDVCGGKEVVGATASSAEIVTLELIRKKSWRRR
jgi:hypothetical protein